MGTLFPDGPEYPDFRPNPSVLLAALQAGVASLLIAAMLASAAGHHEQPHTHRDTGDPTPRGYQFEVELSTSAPSGPFFFSVGDGNAAVQAQWRTRRNAAHAAINAMASTSTAWLLEREQDRDSTGVFRMT
jgi:hypothetical protein